jgi:hypothetical protein
VLDGALTPRKSRSADHLERHPHVRLVDRADDPVGAAPGAMASGERAEQRLTDLVRVGSEGAFAELQHRCGDGLG